MTKRGHKEERALAQVGVVQQSRQRQTIGIKWSSATEGVFFVVFLVHVVDIAPQVRGFSGREAPEGALLLSDGLVYCGRSIRLGQRTRSGSATFALRTSTLEARVLRHGVMAAAFTLQPALGTENHRAKIGTYCAVGAPDGRLGVFWHQWPVEGRPLTRALGRRRALALCGGLRAMSRIDSVASASFRE
ncbi:MAG TPA: hypothetical protein VGS27_33395 [Candidatus Sulfotelmatobacter sp.]|nr:hypothetical protein [Candidatus Sulfotelmatobacter sp.]